MKSRNRIREIESPSGIFNSAYLGLSLSIIYLAVYVFIGIFSHDSELALSCFVGILIGFSAIGFVRFMSTIVEDTPH